MFPILSLPDEIIAYHLVPQLEEADIISLFLTSKQFYQILNQQIVWHTLFIKKFGEIPIPFETVYKWPQLVKLRKQSHVYTWGQWLGGRLGIYPSRVNPSHIHANNDMYRHTPISIPSLVDNLKNEVVIDISGSGFYFTILTESGVIYNTGTGVLDIASFGAPRHENMRTHQLQVPAYIRRLMTPEATAHGPPTDATQTRGADSTVGDYIRRLISPNDGLEHKRDQVHFTSISNGRCHTLALHNKRNLWVWDCKKQGNTGIMMDLNLEFLKGVEGFRSRMKESEINILKIRSGWNYNSCLIHNFGILVWFDRKEFKNYVAEFGDEAFLISYMNFENGSSCKVADYIALEDCLVVVTDSGTAYKVQFKEHRLYEAFQLTAFHEALNKNTREYHNSNSKFIRVSGSYKRFALMTNDDRVFLGNNEVTQFTAPAIVPELQNRGCISISFGDYHQLALFKNGELYSFGRDSSMCGCLGLGGLSNEEIHRVMERDNSSGVVISPVKVPIDGKVVAISAGGWQSAALVHDVSL